MRKILVSGCLFGWHCRYDAIDLPCTDPRFLRWKEEGRLVAVCPEDFGGLPTPRPDCQRRGNQVIARTGVDYTQAYRKGAEQAVRLAKENQVVCAIMKQGSPSCGSRWIYDGSFTDTKIAGEGLATELLRKSGIPVFDENEIDQVEVLLATRS